MIKIDLHSHSSASKDGGISLEQYKKILNSGTIDVIAITDHDRIDFAQNAQNVLGSENIIVGQEVTTIDGDILGLYLKNPISAGLTAKAAADEIHKQGGLVCVPHPFETFRKGISTESLDKLVGSVDIVEGYNGRAVFQNFSNQALEWASVNSKLTVANSDAHGYKGVGRTYSVVEVPPTDPKSLLNSLSNAKLVSNKPPLITLTYPSINMIIKKLRRVK